ncbi:peptidylprolyl isomerase [uncultured Odoribacter sp.]|uniref:FKBP-type peptidyl-prolyl cis-trans isomerase n=1 Tax=uncultured Odoribacter sp. TaxID=876416 RepID=UPI00260EA6B8|nr:peptidylprolyl isomerase [uncultured Odoribacter sp.]
MITKNKVVSLSYELRTEPDGSVIETADAGRPLEFICGQGQTLEYFEMNLLNKKVGDKFDFKIPAAQAYGERNEDMIVDLPKDIFKEVDPKDMYVGNMLPMMDSIGRHLEGKIVEIGEEDVRIDFNHQLAGKDLYFKGEVLAVRDATDEELEALKSHKCGGCSGCGSEGGCDSKEDSCGCGGCH